MSNGTRMDVTRGATAARNGNQDASLQTGPMPETIDRMRSANNRGIIGPRGQMGFPTFQNTIHVGHIPTFIPVRGVTPMIATTVDDTVHIPSVMAGNPLP